MAHDVQTRLNGWLNFTQTLAALATLTARQSDIIANTGNFPAALIDYRIQSGAAAPVAGQLYEIFLIRGDGTRRTDNAGASDAAITVLNAQLIGTLQVTATANANFTDVYDTAPLGKLGSEWGTIVRNSTSQALNGTEGNHTKAYNLYLPSIQ